MGRVSNKGARRGREERFEVRLSGEDLARARAAMLASGCRKKSVFVRQQLVRGGGSASAAETGALALAVNEALLKLEEADHPEAILAHLGEIRDLLRLLILTRLPERPGAEG